MRPKQSRLQVSPARWAAFEILRRVEVDRAFASPLLAALVDSPLSRSDRALTQELVLGVLRWQRALDFFIEQYSARPVGSLDVSVLIALRMGLYQLRHLSRVPQSAAVNESVNLVKRAGTSSAAGLVNAVLRKSTRHLDQNPGDGLVDAEERASFELSHPIWMIRRWQAAMGEPETRALALSNNSPTGTAFRVNSLRANVDKTLSHLQTEGVTVRESSICPEAFLLESGPASAVHQAAASGLIHIQDEASQLVSYLVEPFSGERVLDVCAAPGSKTSHLAALAGNRAWIIACDRYAHRLSTLRTTCERLGVGSVDAVALDATQPLPFADAALRFDRVLVDAPCSGTGTLRGNPEIKWRLSPDDLTRLGNLQRSLLDVASKTVSIGGRLVYSTCSLEPEENEDVVCSFLKSSSLFRGIRPNAKDDLIASDGFVRTFPHRHGCDGFFAAVMERIR